MLLDNFYSAQAQSLSPVLLEFHNLQILGLNPISILEVKDNKLYKDNKEIGKPLDIFKHLESLKKPTFFPCFMGYFSYEFHEHFIGVYTNKEKRFPDAVFKLYEDGFIYENNKLIHKPKIKLDALKFKHKNLNKGLIKSLVSKEDFLKGIKNIKEQILNGDVYQVNLSLPFSCDLQDNDILSIYYYLRKSNKSPFMGLFENNGQWIISGSPERLFSFKDHILSTRPIAGTKPKGANKEEEENNIKALKASIKENAEHIMLVDLMRNDLNQVCKEGSVKVVEDRTIEFYTHVMHLVSEVSGLTNKSLHDIFKAIFPGGTVTGAPKKNVLKAILQEEKYARGPYTGSLGYVSSLGIDFNMLIRSIYVDNHEVIFNAGAGIVIDSIDEEEWAEVNKKALGIKKVLEGPLSSPRRRGPSEVAICLGPRLRGEDKRMSGEDRRESREDKGESGGDKRILFIENNDSFSFNIINLLKTLGSTLKIATNEDIPENITHVIIGPGPGNPVHMPHLLKVIENAYKKNLPLLGICLGHQAIGHFFGADIIKAPFPMHGKSQAIHHNSLGLFNELISPTHFTRYHSLVVSSAPKDFIIDAKSEDGCIMALRHKEKAIFGLQFHPESYLSYHGQKLLEKFITY